MITWIGTSAKRLLAQCSENRSPSQIAWGVAIGVSLGIVPMDNLTSASLLIATMFLRVNQLAAAIACISVAAICPFVGFLPNRIGAWLLSFSQITSVISGLYQIPGTAWFRFENTQVLGGLFLGLFTLVPNYYSCRLFIIRMQRKLASMAVWNMVQDAAEIRKGNVDAALSVAEQPDSKLAPVLTSPPSASSVEGNQTTAGSLEKIDAGTANLISLSLQNEHRKLRVDAQTASNPTKDSSASEVTNPSPAEAKAGSKSKRKQSFHRASAGAQTVIAETTPTRVDVVPGASETVLRETIIEVVRYRERLDAQASPKKPHSTPLTQPLNNTTTMIVESNSNSSAVLTTASSAGTQEGLATVSSDSAINHPGRSQTLCGPKGTGSLRHLLRHITHSRDTRTDSESTK